MGGGGIGFYPVSQWAKIDRFFKKNVFWAIPGLFLFIFVYSIQLAVNVQYKFLPMTEFEPRTSGIGRNHSTN